MTLDDLVRHELSEMSERVRPLADPYGRLKARQRRSRRRRTVLAGLAAVAVAGAAAVTAINPGGTAQPAGPTGNHAAANVRMWTQRLLDSPVRGAVGADAAFVDRLAAALTARQASGKLPSIDAAHRSVRVLFADDVGPHRIAFAALLRPDAPKPLAEDDGVGIWLVGPAGSTPESLADATRATAVPTVVASLSPFNDVQFGGAPGQPWVSVGLAPDGCRVSSAVFPGATAWRTEPTGSYVVRPDAAAGLERWRVTCGQVVRHEDDAPARLAAVSDKDLDAMIVDARGTVDRATARAVVDHFARGTVALMVPFRLLWCGTVAGTRSLDGTACVVLGKTLRGTPVGMFATAELGVDGTVNTSAMTFTVPTDPDRPDGVLAVDTGGAQPTVLVVAPPGAASMRLVRAGRTTATADVRDGLGLIPAASAEGDLVEAVDGTGRVIGSAPLAATDVDTGTVEAWSED